MLTYNQFMVLRCYLDGSDPSQRAIVRSTKLSLGTVNSVLCSLKEQSLISGVNRITDLGLEALQPHKVENAIIMAAGASSHFAPISYERPKGVLVVAGEVLIERQIRQLKAAGIDDITVVVGYRKEEFFYLESLFGVKIAVNTEYTERNNNSSIYKVRNILGNTYICSSDDYFEENPFEQYVYDSYYAGVYVEGYTKEWCMQVKGKTNEIVGVTLDGTDAWAMLGHAYWSRAFSQRFVELLESVYHKPGVAGMLWEGVYRDHLSELPPMYLRKYDNDIIWEFDTLEDVRQFDPSFINNVDSAILDNICNVLHCQRTAIKDIEPIKQGMTNTSFKFEVEGTQYVYRHPGFGSEEITNRFAETRFQEIARDLGIDRTFIYEDPKTGWKISRFVTDARYLDYHNWDDVAVAMQMIRKLHTCGMTCDYAMDIHQDTLKQIGLLGKRQATQFKDFNQLLDVAEKLNAKVMASNPAPCPCHNDFYDQNFLISKEGIDLIDWEFAAMSDYASDLGVFIACCPDYTYEDALRIFELYFGRKLTQDELFHCVAYTAVVSFHWFIWALYKDTCGEPVGEFLYFYYRYTKLFGEQALAIGKEQ